MVYAPTMTDAQTDYPATHDKTDSSDDAGPMPRIMPLSELVLVTIFVVALLILAVMLYPA
jgi:hypothetical protein